MHTSKGTELVCNIKVLIYEYHFLKMYPSIQFNNFTSTEDNIKQDAMYSTYILLSSQLGGSPGVSYAILDPAISKHH